MDTSYPYDAEIKPLNFDESDAENDENNDPGCGQFCEEVKTLSYRSERMLLNESTSSNASFFQCASESFRVAQKHLQPPNTQLYATPAPGRIMRKRKYHETVKFEVSLPQMPTEVIDEIFSHLNKRDLLTAGATCRRFFQASGCAQHWKKINLDSKRILESALHRMISRKTMALCMTNTVVYTDPALVSRTFALCNLTKLDFSWAKFPDSGLEIIKGILNRCDKLQYLALENQAVDAQLLQMIAKNRDLLVLNLSACQVIDAQSLSNIFQSCTKLTEVNLSWTNPDEPTSTVIVTEIPTSVRRLALSGMGERRAFNDDGLISIIQRLPHLVEMDIGDNMLATSEFIMELTKCDDLRELTAARCYNIEPLSYTTLKQVHVLNLFGSLSPSGIEFMKKQLPKAQINLCPLTKIGRSQKHYSSSKFWGEDISECY